MGRPGHDVGKTSTRIEVIRGPGGSLWGSNAVNNGVINIIVPRSAKDTQGVLAARPGERLRGTGASGACATAGRSATAGWLLGSMGKYLDHGPSFNQTGPEGFDAWC